MLHYADGLRRLTLLRHATHYARHRFRFNITTVIGHAGIQLATNSHCATLIHVTANNTYTATVTDISH